MKRLPRIAMSLALLLAGGYAVADAYDITPGVLTMRPRQAEPEPYPSVSGSAAKAEALPAWDTSAPKPAAGDVEQAIDTLVADPRVNGQASVTVRDAATGQNIATHGDKTGRTPASNMKVVTAAVALRVLGPDATLPTSAKLDGKTMYLVGGGDTLLAAGEGDPSAVQGRAGLADLADAAAKRAKEEGATSVDLVVDSSLFDEPLYQPEVPESDRSYVMEMRPIAVMQSRNASNSYTPDPDLAAAQTFAEALRQRGIAVGSVARGEAPESAKDAGEVRSAPVRDLVDFALTESDNTTSDALGHLIAVKKGEKATFEGGGAATLAELKAMGVPTDSVTIADNSGLSPSNKLTTRLLTELLTRAHDCNGCALQALSSGLPVSAFNGTLDDRYLGTEAAGKVRAKTGTLTTATSLSGYVVTAGGRVLVFSVIVDNVPEGQFAESRAAMDEFVVKLQGLGAGDSGDGGSDGDGDSGDGGGSGGGSDGGSDGGGSDGGGQATPSDG